MTVRVLYHHEVDGWWAESPDIDGWAVAGATYDDVRRLAEDGVTFALATQIDDVGTGFDESRFAAVVLEHYVPAPARTSPPPAGVSSRYRRRRWS